MRAIEDGAYNHTLKARLTTLEQEKVQTEARLRAGKHAPVLRLHTNLPELYRNKIGRLAEALNAPETVTEAADVMRGLIDRIVLTPVADEAGRTSLSIDLHGHLAGILSLATKAKRPLGESGLEVGYTKLVAGTRNHRQYLVSVPI